MSSNLDRAKLWGKWGNRFGRAMCFPSDAGVGWMNDPNGFPFIGENTICSTISSLQLRVGPWGHQKTRDFYQMGQLPALALIPNMTVRAFLGKCGGA